MNQDLKTQQQEQKESADCYSAGERAAMVWWQDLRERWLSPLLKLMSSLGIRPDHLTLASLLVGLMFCPMIFYVPWLAFVCLILHSAIDGLDGPLARHQRVDSKAGSFTDTMCDQLILVAVTVTMMCHPDLLIGILPGTIYIFLYTVVVVFAMVRNAMGIPYSWVVRPRFLIYIWLALEFFVFPGSIFAGSTNIVLWITNALFALKMLTGFLKIRDKL